MYACWVSGRKCNPRRKLNPFSCASHVIHTCFHPLFLNLVHWVLQLFSNSYGHFCFAELEREREGNVDYVNNTCTTFQIYRVSQKFVSPFSCAKTFDLNFMFYEISVYYSSDYMYSDVQSLPKDIIKPYKGTILMTGKVRCVQYLLVFGHIWLNGWKTDPGLETERLDIASIVVRSNKSLVTESRF